MILEDPSYKKNDALQHTWRIYFICEVLGCTTILAQLHPDLIEVQPTDVSSEEVATSKMIDNLDEKVMELMNGNRAPQLLPHCINQRT